jgi:hypothetical protein
MYYRVRQNRLDMNVLLSASSTDHTVLLHGSLLGERDLAVPVEFTARWRPDTQPRWFSWFTTTHLVRPSLVAAMEKAGVNNLQTFPAVIRDEAGKQLALDHVVVNIVGLVACASAGGSVADPLSTKQYFHKLVVDEGRAAGLLLFRLEESPLDVIVHERVVKALAEVDTQGVEFESLDAAKP